MLRKVLGRNGILIEAEDVGGSSSRTVHWDVATGLFTIKSRGQETEL